MSRHIAQYVMLDSLGEGGFSKVYLGLDPLSSPPTRVALKLLKKSSLSSSQSFLKQAEREIAALSLIRHPHVLQMLDVQWSSVHTKKNGLKEEVVLIVLELATGGELFDYLSFTGRFDECLARTYFHQLINGVGYCHNMGLAHRDLKPENLLLNDNYALKVADFGLSNVFASPDDQEGQRKQRLLYTECGTPAYMAPEVFARQGYDGCAADVWSCGVILFIMVAGFPPFQKPSMNDWWFNKLATHKTHLFWQAHTRSATFSPALITFLTALLTVDPRHRLKVTNMMRYEWFMGETLSADKLFGEVRTRKEQVDSEKMKEKMEKDKQRRHQEEAMSDETPSIGSLEDGLYRSHENATSDSDSDTLPSVLPSLALGAPLAKPQQLTNVLTTEALNEAISMLEINEQHEQKQPPAAVTVLTQTEQTEAGEAADTHEEAGVPVYDPSSTLPTLTILRSCLPYSQLLARIIAILEQNRFTVSFKPDQHRIKAQINTLLGPVIFSVQIWREPTASPPQAATKWIVEFRRRSGDSAQYRELFGELFLQLQPIISEQKQTEQ